MQTEAGAVFSLEVILNCFAILPFSQVEKHAGYNQFRHGIFYTMQRLFYPM
jgi:hypothetical protein